MRHCRALFPAALVLAAPLVAPADAPAPGTLLQYRVIPGEQHGKLPVEWVNVIYGPTEGTGTAWQVEGFGGEDGTGPALYQLRAVTDRDPLGGSDAPPVFSRYQLRIPETNETYDYRDACNPGKALLPGWEDFTKWFVPRPADWTRRDRGAPVTACYLGHVLTLREVRDGAAWEAWEPKVLELDGEMLVGTGRTVKDSEEKRLPQQPERQNYKYVEWTPENYRTMIDAGFNYFALVKGIEAELRAQPVFYRRRWAGDAPLRFPADLYRSNLAGPVMFIDEPSCILTGQKPFFNQSKWFTDFTAALLARVRAEVRHARHAMEHEARPKVSLGEMRLGQPDIVAWETRYMTAHFQFMGGCGGFVHESRHQLGEFTASVKASTGIERAYTGEEMFRYQFAMMRGAARQFGGDWGTSIYGQADPALNPLAVTLAYDMGARYVWFWTSDHDHHMPWPEQLALAKHLKEHRLRHPRRSIRSPQPERDKAIIAPAGSLLVLESPTQRKDAWDLWWVRELDPEGRNEASRRYRRLMTALMTEVNKALDAKEDFDIVIDDGRPVTGYRAGVRLAAE